MENEASSKIHQVCVEIWNSKYGGNIYFEFEATFGALSKVHFGQTIYRFEALKVKNPMLQIVKKIRTKIRKLCTFETN